MTRPPAAELELRVPSSIDELRLELHAAGRDWWVCRCGRALYEHVKTRLPNSGADEYLCYELPGEDGERGRFEPVTLPELDYQPGRGLHRPS